MGFYALAYLYRNRLRVHAAQELLAGLGVAVAVALVSATLIASGSIAGSAGEVVHTVIGPANLQLRTRGPEGFPETLLPRVEHLPGVQQAAPMLEETATLVGPSGRRVAIYLAGADLSLATLDGLAHTIPRQSLSAEGISLSTATATALQLPPTVDRSEGEPPLELLLRGRSYPQKISAVLGREAAGALAGARIAVMPLTDLQRLAGQRGRVSRILIKTKPGAEAVVRKALSALAGGRLTVARSDQDLALLHQALGPSDQASGLFAAISALLGFLFAFNAMLLTAPERRQTIADLRVDGTRRGAIVQLVLFQALCLGVVAAAVGLLAGYGLAVGLFHQSTGYLSQAFTLGSSTVVGASPMLIALACGLVATCLGACTPLLDLQRGRASDAVYDDDAAPGNQLGSDTRNRLTTGALALLALASALYALVPSAALAACVLLALATMLAVPIALAAVMRATAFLGERYPQLTLVPVALTGLRATTLRSMALAATGAVALFGCMALGGARGDLLRGIGQVAHRFSDGAQLWVISPQDNQATVAFLPRDYAARVATLAAVTGVGAYQGSFFDWGERRPWIIARPANETASVLEGQILQGKSATAARRLREGGWIVLSKQIASEHHLRLGGIVRLPTPTGLATFRLAATNTNFGWPTGVIFMSTRDYTRVFATSALTALGVDLQPGASIPQAKAAIERRLEPGSGLEVVTPGTRAARIEASGGEGLGQLGEIAKLLLAATIVAMVAALGSSIWQQRISLASLRLEGTQPFQLRRLLMVEALVMLSAGCLTGALAGVYGQLIIDSYLKHVTGFPVASLVTATRPIEILALVLVVVLALAAIPGWLASRVRPTLAFGED
ncbi:MAG TPA: ABC transporter permease [Solirubrobacteraceae bacterium]|jgi:putative ABC transport system permease protein|nr:ABC transporter permease [Solirubrobacteraceae bacterium]